MKFIRACIITDHHYYAPYLTSQAEYISCSFTGVSWAFYWQDCPPQGPLTWLVPLTNFPTNFLHLGQTCLLLIYLYFLPQTPAGTVFSFSNTRCPPPDLCSELSQGPHPQRNLSWVGDQFHPALLWIEISLLFNLQLWSCLRSLLTYPLHDGRDLQGLAFPGPGSVPGPQWALSGHA